MTFKGRGCAPTCVVSSHSLVSLFGVTFWCHFLVSLPGFTLWCHSLVSLSLVSPYLILVVSIRSISLSHSIQKIYIWSIQGKGYKRICYPNPVLKDTLP